LNQPILSDVDLLNGLISQDEILISRFYDLYFDAVKNFVLKNRGNVDDAMDLFQDSIIVLFQKVRKKDFFLSSSLKTFLLSIARIIWLKELERRKKLSDILQSPSENYITDDIYEIYEYNERMFLYRKHFDRLSHNCRKILKLFLDGLSIKDITSIMGYKNEQHTKNRRYRCKLSLINSIRATIGFNELG